MENTKPSLNKKDKIYAVVLIVLQISFLIFIITTALRILSTYGPGEFSLIGVVYIELLIGIPLSIWGILKGIFLLKDRIFHVLSLILLLISIFSFPYVNGPILSRIYLSISEKAHEPEVARQKLEIEKQKAEYANNYAQIAKDLSSSQVILAADMNTSNFDYPVIILKNGYIIGLPEVKYGNHDKYVNFINWINSNLTNKSVTISIPPLKEMYGDNNLGMYVGLNDCNENIPILLRDVRKKYNIEGYNNCSVIRSDEIYYNGKGLYSEYLK
ncbi:MAG: hypothetical protein NTX85_02345 [Candidatus Nomurabacteria bacterium]|nr:hypothetical protein [Candidatus Nomurabacteria bacterium]